MCACVVLVNKSSRLSASDNGSVLSICHPSRRAFYLWDNVTLIGFFPPGWNIFKWKTSQSKYIAIPFYTDVSLWFKNNTHRGALILPQEIACHPDNCSWLMVHSTSQPLINRQKCNFNYFLFILNLVFIRFWNILRIKNNTGSNEYRILKDQ